MIGELAALASALTWAGSTVLLRSLSKQLPLLTLGAGRTLVGTLAYWMVFVAVAGPPDVAKIPSWALGSLALGVVFGLLCGDLLYLQGQQLIGVSRALPISASYPIVTAVLAVLVLDEALSVKTLLGIVLTIAGVTLIARVPAGKPLDAPGKRANAVGLAAAFGASFFWALSTITLKPAVEAVGAPVANAIRLPLAATLLVALATSRSQFSIWHFGWRMALFLSGVGILHAMSSGFYVVALQFSGAAKAATLSSTAPLFAAPLAAIFVHERPGRMVLFGTLLSVAGILLVV